MKPQFKHEEIYLDLSKLSEDKRKEVRRLLFKKPHYEKLFFLPDYEDKPFLICLYGKWDLEVNKRREYTELTYSQFLDMMGESEEKSKVIENSEKELINNDGTLYIGEGLENYYKDQLERTGKFKVVAIDSTSEEVLQVENNGWIKIESEADLPKEVDQYWFASHNNKIEIRFYNPNWIDDRVQFRHRYTHYQPIQKPEPPKF